MNKILKAYRFYEGTLEKLEFIAKARKELGWFETSQTDLIERLIWKEAERLEELLERKKEWEP